MTKLISVLFFVFALVVKGQLTTLGAGLGGKAAASGPITQIQRKDYSSTASNTTHTITPTSTPTSGNLIIILITSAAVTTQPSGWSTGVTNADFTGAGIFYKTSAGNETSITETLGSSQPCTIVFLEYSNLTNTLDKTASAIGQGGINFNTGTTAATTASAELAVALVSIETTGALNTGWNNSFSADSAQNTTGSGTNIFGGTATLILAATGTQTTTLNMLDTGTAHGTGLIATFK